MCCVRSALINDRLNALAMSRFRSSQDDESSEKREL